MAEVAPFINLYLGDAWKVKHTARQSGRKQQFLAARAREAFFSLCDSSDLVGCWETYELQIVERLLETEAAGWHVLAQGEGRAVAKQADALAAAIMKFGRSAEKKHRSKNPASSHLRMGNMYKEVHGVYENLRELLDDMTEEFDQLFLQWLYFVYDPLKCLLDYFSANQYPGGLRIREGTAGRVDEKAVIKLILQEMTDRRYGVEQESWLAWLLRFALPEELDPKRRFREVPCALAPSIKGKYGQWTHVVIDEAQDLSVPEASLLCSFVDPLGALTISADFKQIVSPVHGMNDTSAIRVGSPLPVKEKELTFNFSKNMRQTREITNFLRGFYKKNFGEIPPFEPNEDFSDEKPELFIMSEGSISQRIRQRWNLLQRSGKGWSVALLQVNEDEDQMTRLRDHLFKEGVPLAPLWAAVATPGHLLTTSVERIKGLEFDICFVIGLDDIENTSLRYTVNRAYVAISRPARRLSLFCREFPSLLKGIDTALFDVNRS